MHINIDHLRAMAASAEMDVTVSRKARERLQWLIHFAEHGYSASETCRHFGINTVTFYRMLKRFDPENIHSLDDKSRRPLRVRSAVTPETAALIRACRRQYPHLSLEKLTLLLAMEHNVSLSTSTVARVLEKRGEESQPEAAVPVASFHAAPAPQPFAALTSLCSESSEGCLSCSLKTYRRQRARKALIVASVLSNVALIGFLLGTVFFEVHDPAPMGPTSASVLTLPSKP